MEALDYARDLISFDSISPVSNLAVTDYVEEKLKRLGVMACLGDRPLFATIEEAVAAFLAVHSSDNRRA